MTLVERREKMRQGTGKGYYGKPLSDDEYLGPMYLERSSTNVFSAILFLLFLALWAGIATYAYRNGKIDVDLHDIEGDIKKGIHEKITNSTIEDEFSVAKVIASKNIIAGFVSLSAVLALVYIALLRFCTKFFVYTLTFLGLATTLFFSITFLIAFFNEEDVEAKREIGMWSLAHVMTFLITAIIFLIHRKKVKIACEVIRESSKAVTFFPSSLVFPILPYLMYIGVVVYTGSVSAYLAAIPKVNDETPGHIHLFHVLNVFGGIWSLCFVTAFTQMTLSGSFATWYWTLDKNYVPSFTILSFTGKTIRYHFGTIALGSLLLAVFGLFKFIFGIMTSISKKTSVYECLECLFSCIEKFLSYLNRNAYIMTSMHGTGYWQSAKDAFNLLMRNFLKIAILNDVTDIILFLGNAFVVGLSVAATWGYCKQADALELSPTAMLVVGIFSTLICASFTMVLKTAIDTIFLCVMEDYERNDGSQEKPYFMSFQLREILLNGNSMNV